MKPRQLAVDAAFAFAACYLTLAMLSGDQPAGRRPLDWPAVGLVAASALALLARRRSPLAVFVVSTVAALPLVLSGYALDYPFIPLVAAYSLGDSNRRGRSRADDQPAARSRAVTAARTLATGAASAVLVGAEAWVWFDASWRQAAYRAALWAVGVTLAWLLGDRARMRRDSLGALRLRAERAERERRLAVAEERTRIARELHDSTAHTLNAIAMQAGAARLLFDREPATASAAIRSIEDAARRSIGEIDGILRALRADGGLPADADDLKTIIGRHRDAGLDVTVAESGERGGLPRGLDWALRRIVGEALTNAERHGDGTARLEVRYGAAAVDVVVTNPPGASRAPADTGGHGLIGMRERAELLGGELDAANVDGMFRLRAKLPREKP